MTEAEKYKLSQYVSERVLHESEIAKVELTKCSLDEKYYIKKTYNSDKRNIFRILSRIENRHIPKIYEVFFGEDTIIIEEFIEGNTLEKMLSDGAELSKAQVNLIFNDLLDAINVLHKNKIVHRDIKPSNIIIRENGGAVLIDYSIARPYSDKRNTDTELFGTVGYAAPEQFGFSQSDYRTDIYALGVTMKEIADSHNSSKRLNSAISRCMEFDPSRRFQNIDEIYKYLEKGKDIKAVISVSCIVAAAIAVCVFSQSFEKETETISNEGYPQTLETSSVVTEDPINEHNSSISELFYSCIINTPSDENDLSCIRMWYDGDYSAEIEVGEEIPPISITAEKIGSRITITLNNEVFSLEDTYVPQVYSYPNSMKAAEIVIYDINEDGKPDFIPVICDAVIAENNGDTEFLRNYSAARCIYSDAQGKYIQAEGDMYSYLDPITIYESSPDCLWVDFPSYYRFENGKMVFYDR